MRMLRLTEEELKEIQKKVGRTRTVRGVNLERETVDDTTLDTLLHQVQLLDLPAPVVEHRFHPERKWRFDAAWPDHLVAIEIEGGVWTGGRHVRPEGYKKDMEKYNSAQKLGWTVLRYSTDQIKQGDAMRDLREVFKCES